MAVGVNEVVRTHRHPGDANLAAKTFGVDISVRGSDRAGKGLEARRPLRNVTDRAVSDDAETAERLVHRALNLTPERAEPGIGAVDILDDADARTMAGADIFVIRDPPLLLFGGRKAGGEHRADGHGARIADDRRQIGNGHTSGLVV